jgi:hypothetical protein
MSMWQRGLASSNDASTSMGAFFETSEWLSENLDQNEIVVVPSIEIFLVLNPELSQRFVNYRSIWDSADISFQERSSAEKLQKLQNYFNEFLKENPKVKYLVLDWVDPYARYIFEKNDELLFLLEEVKVIPFTLSTGWSNKITIYERAEYASLFSFDFSVPPKQFSILPTDALVQFDSDGATIHKANSRVSLYLPMEEGINASEQNYLTMHFKYDIADLSLQLVFYYDYNRDGRWSGYNVDYVKSATFDQTKLGAKGGWHTIYQIIPQADDSVIQIGLLLNGDHDGVTILSDLAVYVSITR